MYSMHVQVWLLCSICEAFPFLSPYSHCLRLTMLLLNIEESWRELLLFPKDTCGQAIQRPFNPNLLIVCLLTCTVCGKEYYPHTFVCTVMCCNECAIHNHYSHTYSDLDREIREIIRRQSDAGYDGRQALEDAEKTIEILFARIKNIREKAERTEQTVSASHKEGCVVWCILFGGDVKLVSAVNRIGACDVHLCAVNEWSRSLCCSGSES